MTIIYFTFINMIGSIYIHGIFILFVAIVFNTIAKYFNICTWYDFIKNIQDKGFKKTIKSIKYYDYFWLYILYPLILGLICLK